MNQSFQDIFAQMSTSAFGWLAKRTEKTFTFLREKLSLADIKILLRTYLAMIYMASFLVAIFAFVISFNVLIVLTDVTQALIYSCVIFIFVFLASIAFGISYPSMKAQERKRNIETNLPFAIIHIASIASSGVPPGKIFKLLTNYTEYGAIAEEARKITRNIELLGMDVTSAIREVARTTPSENFRLFLSGFASTIDTGGDLYSFLRTEAEKALFEYRIKREKYFKLISTYADIYTALLIVAPFFFVAVLAMMSLIEGTLWGLRIEDIIFLATFVILPFINILFLLWIHFRQPEL